MPKYLGIDYGRKRIGMAVSDPDARVATPLRQIECGSRPEEQIHSIREAVAEYEVEALVLGLPLNMDGSESAQSRTTRAFGARLAAALGLPVDYWDERLSSYAADRLLDERDGLTRGQRSARRDALAAQVILQGFLDQRNQSTP